MLEKHRGTSVLIVEDSATQADQLRFFLEKGYEVHGIKRRASVTVHPSPIDSRM